MNELARRGKETQGDAGGSVLPGPPHPPGKQVPEGRGRGGVGRGHPRGIRTVRSAPPEKVERLYFAE